MHPEAYDDCHITLCATRANDTSTISIGDLAFEYGFPQTGRFAAYYRAHFGETPSETLRSRSVSIRGASDDDCGRRIGTNCIPRFPRTMVNYFFRG